MPGKIECNIDYSFVWSRKEILAVPDKPDTYFQCLLASLCPGRCIASTRLLGSLWKGRFYHSLHRVLLSRCFASRGWHLVYLVPDRVMIIQVLLVDCGWVVYGRVVRLRSTLLVGWRGHQWPNSFKKSLETLPRECDHTCSSIPWVRETCMGADPPVHTEICSKS